LPHFYRYSSLVDELDKMVEAGYVIPAPSANLNNNAIRSVDLLLIIVRSVQF
jgi:hypothetical protein